MTTPTGFNPKIGREKALKDAGVTAVAAVALGGIAALTSPELTESVTTVLATVIPPPWGPIVAVVGLAALKGGVKYGMDWAKRRRPQAPPLGEDQLRAARERYLNKDPE